MLMKKIFILLGAMLCVATVSAQSKFETTVKQIANDVANTKSWSIGVRTGTALQLEAECFYSDKAYLEAIVGVGGYLGKYPGLEGTLLHNWNCCTWDWTPNAGHWFLDAGVGVNAGGSGHHVQFGLAGQAKFGIQFKKVPIRLAVDVTPVVGPWIDYHREKATDSVTGESVVVDRKDTWHFNGPGLCGAAISATYCF